MLMTRKLLKGYRAPKETLTIQGDLFVHCGMWAVRVFPDGTFRRFGLGGPSVSGTPSLNGSTSPIALGQGAFSATQYALGFSASPTTLPGDAGTIPGAPTIYAYDIAELAAAPSIPPLPQIIQLSGHGYISRVVRAGRGLVAVGMAASCEAVDCIITDTQTGLSEVVGQRVFAANPGILVAQSGDGLGWSASRSDIGKSGYADIDGGLPQGFDKSFPADAQQLFGLLEIPLVGHGGRGKAANSMTSTSPEDQNIDGAIIVHRFVSPIDNLPDIGRYTTSPTLYRFADAIGHFKISAGHSGISGAGSLLDVEPAEYAPSCYGTGSDGENMWTTFKGRLAVSRNGGGFSYPYDVHLYNSGGNQVYGQLIDGTIGYEEVQQTVVGNDGQVSTIIVKNKFYAVGVWNSSLGWFTVFKTYDWSSFEKMPHAPTLNVPTSGQTLVSFSLGYNGGVMLSWSNSGGSSDFRACNKIEEWL